MRPEQYQSIAMQSLLPGLQVAAERAVASLNEARGFLGLRPLVLQPATEVTMQRLPKQTTGSLGTLLIVDAYTPEPEQTRAEATGQEQTPAEATEPAPRRVMTPSAKKKLVSFTAERWRIVKEAGLDSGGRLPSNEMLEKAKKILARRAAKAGGA
jgi:hypothetical protein